MCAAMNTHYHMLTSFPMPCGSSNPAAHRIAQHGSPKAFESDTHVNASASERQLEFAQAPYDSMRCIEAVWRPGNRGSTGQRPHRCSTVRGATVRERDPLPPQTCRDGRQMPRHAGPGESPTDADRPWAKRCGDLRIPQARGHCRGR